MSYQFTRSYHDDDLKAIIALQALNMEKALENNEVRKEGFVTVKHSFDLLKRMNTPHPHFIVKSGGELVAYALVMDQQFKAEIPVLIPMFETFNSCSYKERFLSNFKYVVMGQICIAKEHRAKGIFKRLYEHMQKDLPHHYELILTEVADRNIRSLNAHLAAGFQLIKKYKTGQEHWSILVLEMAS